jgi:hypothetical protein
MPPWELRGRRRRRRKKTYDDNLIMTHKTLRIQSGLETLRVVGVSEHVNFVAFLNFIFVLGLACISVPSLV